ncbi:MAG: Hsp20/alpha crystallin family protein [Gemmatimonadota bacterium]
MTTDERDETTREAEAGAENATATDAGAGGTGEHAGAEAGAESAAEDGGKRSSREVPFADNIHGLVDDILEGVRSFTPVAGVRYPRYDFVETPEAYLLAFDLPGVTREEISVTTEGEDLVVSGERAEPEWGEEAVVRRSERPVGGFRRTMRMPVDVRVEDVRARLEEGILTITLPRHTDRKSRKVDIEE